jgi:hypothetical protein
MRNQRLMLAVVGMTVLLGTGCACMYGACGGTRNRTVTMKYDGEDCWTLSLAMNSRNVLGESGRKPHNLGGSRYYVDCLYFQGKKGSTVTFQVRSSDFAPDIYLIENDKEGSLANDNGSSMATVSATLPKNDTYAFLVTSVRPLETGDYTIAYESD